MLHIISETFETENDIFEVDRPGKVSMKQLDIFVKKPEIQFFDNRPGLFENISKLWEMEALGRRSECCPMKK